jgi:hypothetical protein
MSAALGLESPAKIRISIHVCCSLFAFGCRVLLVIYWSSAKAKASGTLRFDMDSMSDDPEYREPASAPNSLREFRKTWPFPSPEAPNGADAIGTFDPIPCVAEQGISEAITGKETSRTGNLAFPRAIPARFIADKLSHSFGQLDLRPIRYWCPHGDGGGLG